MAKERKTVTVELPVDVERDDGGLVYVTCPLIRGLLVAVEGEENIAAKVNKAVAALGSVA
jgi:hypothetical protein